MDFIGDPTDESNVLEEFEHPYGMEAVGIGEIGLAPKHMWYGVNSREIVMEFSGQWKARNRNPNSLVGDNIAAVTIRKAANDFLENPHDPLVAAREYSLIGSTVLI